MKKLISFIFLSCLSFLLYPQKYQPGYIITNLQDTIYGLVNNRDFIENSKSCEFKKDQSHEPVIYKPFDIQSYRFTDGKYYISKNVVIDSTKEAVFLEYLIKGKVDFYFMRNQEGNIYFIQKGNDSLIVMKDEDKYYNYDPYNKKYLITKNQNGQMTAKSTKYIGILRYELGDAPQIKEKIDNADLSHSSLIKLGKAYHYAVCKDYDCMVFEKKKSSGPQIGITIQPDFLAYHPNEYTLKIRDRTYINKYIISTGITLRLPLSTLNERMFMTASALVSSTQRMVESFVEPITHEYIIDSINSTTLFIPIIFQYCFIKQSHFNTYIGLGPQFSYSFIQDNFNMDLGVSPEDPYTGLFFGGTTSVGCSYLISRNLLLDINFGGFLITNKYTSRKSISSSFSLYYIFNQKK